jgi:polyhydroxyalkanoate synthase
MYTPDQVVDSFTKEFTDISNKLMKSYTSLLQVEEVEVATAPKKLVWQSGKVKLYHYENPNPVTCKVPILTVYALVNRQDMLDLQPDRSVIRKLLELGMDIYIIDWGYASKVDRYTTMEDYIEGYIDDCVNFIRKTNQVQKVNLMAICQGGTLSTIYAALHPEKVNSLVTLVTPIDFDTEDGLLFKWSRDLDIDTIVDGYGGVVPGEFLNFGFDMLKPLGKVKKYHNLPDTMMDKEKLMNFLRMEKWIADSPDQAGACYKQFVKDLYQRNKLVKGELEIGGKTVSLRNITMPLLNIYAAEDHLVPPSASIPLNDYVGTSDKTLYEFPGGHIGVFVGNRSQKELGPTIAKWISDRSNS